MNTIQHVLGSKGKCKILAKMHICMVNKLPSEIIIDILSRLPTDSILVCGQVCKPWLNLIRHPSFAHMHLHRNVKVGLGLLFPFCTYSEKQDYLLYYGEYDDQSNKKLRRLNQPSIHSLSIVGSRNGLICYSDRSIIHEPIHISNPITREFMKFPRLEVNVVGKVDTMVCGFGYLPSTDTYKTVKIYYIRDQPTGRVQVYTLGGGSCSGWRDIGEIAYSLRNSDIDSPYHPCSFGAFANGALHWLDNEQNIVSFNLADEKLYLLQSPPLIGDLNRDDSLKLQVFGGCLCFIHKKRNKFLHIWFLRKKGESSSSSDINEQECDSLTWIKELSLPTDASPIAALTKSGEYLMWYNSKICSYDPKTATMKKLALDYHFGTAEPHMNSFVSLKALGGKCWSRKRYAVNPTPTKYFMKQQRKYNGEFDVTQF